jgi:erythromycin esterase
MSLLNKSKLISYIFVFLILSVSFLFLSGCNFIEDSNNFYTNINTYDDLSSLVRIMSEHDVVLLGESTHGTQEYYAIRSEISKRLIEEYGFKVIAVEGDWDSMYGLNLYSKGMSEKESARDVLEEFDRWPVWMWANSEIKQLGEWLKEFNKELSLQDKAGIYGMDVYGVERSIITVQSLLGDVYRCLFYFIEDFSIYTQYLSAGYEPCNTEAEQVYEFISTNKELIDVLDAKDYFYLKQSAFVVMNAEKHYRAMVDASLSSWNERVMHMDSTIKKLMKQHDSKVIVWAHNTHIGDARATSMATSGSLNIGQLFRQDGKNIFILGFGTYSGEVLAGRRWAGPMEKMIIPKANENSYEHILKDMGFENVLIMLNHTDLPDELKAINNNRAIGVVYNPEHEYPGNYVTTNLVERYDAFIFIKETNALELLS